MKEDLKKMIVEISEEQGWAASFLTGWKEENIEFETSTPAGQDLVVNVFSKCFVTLSDVAEMLTQYADSFDECYETYKWLGPDGHGENGAPYHMGDILEDMVSAKRMIYDLAEIFDSYSNNGVNIFE